MDLYYQHRVPDSIPPVEDVAGVMGELIAEGKILGWGQSQATEEQIRRAHAVTPLTAIQSEYSLMERMFERDVIPRLRGAGHRLRRLLAARHGLPQRPDHGGGHVPGSGRPPGHHPLRQGQHPRQPAPPRPAHRVRSREERDARAGLDGLDAAQEGLHRPDSRLPQDRARRGEPGAADVELTAEEFARIETALAGIEIHGNRTDEDIAKLLIKE